MPKEVRITMDVRCSRCNKSLTIVEDKAGSDYDIVAGDYLTLHVEPHECGEAGLGGR